MTNLKIGTFDSKFSEQVPDNFEKKDVQHYVDYILEIITKKTGKNA